MAADPGWVLFDFGCLQCLRHTLLGLRLPVHGGRNSLFSDGPFKLITHGDRFALVGLQGGDEDCPIHWVDEICNSVAEEMEDENGNVDYYIKGAIVGDKPDVLLSSLQDHYDVLPLSIDVEGDFPPFKAEFHRYKIPILLQDGCQVSLWLSFRRLIVYVWGPMALDNVWLRVSRFKRELENAGLDPNHIIDSSRALRARQKAFTRKADEVASETDADYLMSPQAFILFLDSAIHTDKQNMRMSEAIELKAKSLLTCLLSWPLGQTVSFGFRSEKGKCEMLIFDGCKVSYDALVESESAFGIGEEMTSHRSRCPRNAAKLLHGDATWGGSWGHMTHFK